MNCSAQSIPRARAHRASLVPPHTSLVAGPGLQPRPPKPWKRRPKSPKGQLFADLNALYRRNINRRATREGDVGQKTRRERRVVIEAALRELHRRGLELRRLKNLRAKHVRVVLLSWRERGLLPSTVSSYISHLRVFCDWLGKPQLIAMIDDYLATNPDIARRRLVADRDRSELGAGVAFEDIFTKALALDERYACTLLLMKVFGLRILEALLLRPHLVEGAKGEVRILWGTKGGRPRVLPTGMENPQRRALAWARTFAHHRAASMVPPSYTLQRWRRHCYYLNEKMGFTRADLGATPHSLRHGASCDLYQILAGAPAAVRGGTLSQADPEADRAVRKVVAEFLGHSRPHITSAYVGGVVRSSKRSKEKREIIDSSPQLGEAGPSTLGTDRTPVSDEDTPQ
jgi:integrase